MELRRGQHCGMDRRVNGRMDREPPTLQRVRSLITEPAEEAQVDRGELVVRGVAWSGAAPIARVEVRLDDGPWQEARMLGESNTAPIKRNQ
jgi:Mo-co oxidoreductase dimerisation domain